MIIKTLSSALGECNNGSHTKIKINDTDFLTPSYIVSIAAYIKKHQIPKATCVFSSKHDSYLKAISFYDTLWSIPCDINRPNAGKSYSLLTLLEDEDSTDFANKQITDCISHLTSGSKGINALKDVIGELHDNVWSHGYSSGFSMAQTYREYIEFALADLGGGFLRELNRVGMNIDSHKKAIEWCIKKGNSSKRIKQDDGWRQSIPSDVINNPIKGIGSYNKSNNHAGLGLAKLIELIQQYQGNLLIASGNAILSITPFANKISYKENPSQSWDGVSIMCKLELDKLQKISPPEDREVQNVLAQLTD